MSFFQLWKWKKKRSKDYGILKEKDCSNWSWNVCWVEEKLVKKELIGKSNDGINELGVSEKQRQWMEQIGSGNKVLKIKVLKVKSWGEKRAMLISLKMTQERYQQSLTILLPKYPWIRPFASIISTLAYIIMYRNVQ